MTPKEYLQQARHMRTRMDALEERRQRYLDMATKSTAHYRSGPGGTRRVSSVEEGAVKLADLAEEMRIRSDIYAEALRGIEAAIDAVEPALYRDVLKLRFLNGWYWERIGKSLHYTRQGVDNICRNALRRVRVPRDAEPVEDIVRRALREHRTPKAKE